MNLITRFPVAIHSLTGSTLWLAGDALSQHIEARIEDEERPLQFGRLATMGTFGLFAGPAYAIWYRLLDRHVPRLFSVQLKSAIGSQRLERRVRWQMALTKGESSPLFAPYSCCGFHRI